MSAISFNFGLGILQLGNGSALWDIRMETNNAFHIYTSSKDAGVPGDGMYLVNDNTGWHTPSDLRIKRDIHPIPSVLEKVLQLNPVTFNFKTQPLDSPPIEGFIAQEIETIFPSLVSELTSSNCGYNIKGINLTGVIPYVVKSIQEQYEIETEMQNDIDVLSDKLKQMTYQNAKLDILISEIQKTDASI